MDQAENLAFVLEQEEQTDGDVIWLFPLGGGDMALGRLAAATLPRPGLGCDSGSRFWKSVGCTGLKPGQCFC